MKKKLKTGCQKKPVVEAKTKGLWPPKKGIPYRVKDGDDWGKLAAAWGLPARNLIGYNFNTIEPPEVNWYLDNYVGCDLPTVDRYNWQFSYSASPGVIYRPPADWDPSKVPGLPVVIVRPDPLPDEPIVFPKLSQKFSIRLLGGLGGGIKKGVSAESIFFEIRNDESGDSAYYNYLAAGIGNSVLPVSMSTDGPWNSFKTSEAIMETSFDGFARISQISAGSLGRTVLHMLGTPEGVDSVYIENFKTGFTADAGGSTTAGSLLLLDYNPKK